MVGAGLALGVVAGNVGDAGLLVGVVQRGEAGDDAFGGRTVGDEAAGVGRPAFEPELVPVGHDEQGVLRQQRGGGVVPEPGAGFRQRQYPERGAGLGALAAQCIAHGDVALRILRRVAVAAKDVAVAVAVGDDERGGAVAQHGEGFERVFVGLADAQRRQRDVAAGGVVVDQALGRLRDRGGVRTGPARAEQAVVVGGVRRAVAARPCDRQQAGGGEVGVRQDLFAGGEVDRVGGFAALALRRRGGTLPAVDARLGGDGAVLVDGVRVDLVGRGGADSCARLGFRCAPGLGHFGFGDVDVGAFVLFGEREEQGGESGELAAAVEDFLDAGGAGLVDVVEQVLDFFGRVLAARDECVGGAERPGLRHAGDRVHGGDGAADDLAETGVDVGLPLLHVRVGDVFEEEGGAAGHEAGGLGLHVREDELGVERHLDGALQAHRGLLEGRHWQDADHVQAGFDPRGDGLVAPLARAGAVGGERSDVGDDVEGGEDRAGDRQAGEQVFEGGGLDVDADQVLEPARQDQERVAGDGVGHRGVVQADVVGEDDAVLERGDRGLGGRGGGHGGMVFFCWY